MSENDGSDRTGRVAVAIPGAPWVRHQPPPAEVEGLIAAARVHPLGVEFLAQGELGAVAVTFGVHAFTVDAARRRLGGGA